jgi:hypothetical protein
MAINPVVDPKVDGQVLRFDNIAERSGVAESDSAYQVMWFTYDNESGARTQVGTPAVCPRPRWRFHSTRWERRDYAGVEIRTLNTNHALWARPVRFYLRRGSYGWLPVGVDRRETRDTPGRDLSQ